jgi:ubiquinol-cytochrome c reductase cytochrome c subunit
MRRVALLLVLASVLSTPAAASRGELVLAGRQLYVQGCISCHGKDARGVQRYGPARGVGGVRGAGPSLHGVGALAADFYLRTGYMPLGRADSQPKRGPSPYTDDQIDALVAFVASLGGPPVPSVHPERGSISEGLRLYTENCAGCHQIAAAGGIVTGAVAPSLQRASATEIAEAVRVGPYLMPRFPKSQLPDRELDSIARYVLSTRDPDDRGGWSIGHLGPVPEGLVAWLLAGGVLVVVVRLIGAR